MRLSAGRSQMTDELQALCLHAGASSIFLGDQLLTTPNPGDDHDRELLDRLDMQLAAPVPERASATTQPALASVGGGRRRRPSPT